MSLADGYSWSYKGHKLLGYSVAGITTSIIYDNADVCFDVAQGLPFQMNIETFLITHGHMDHAVGIPYVIGQKAMLGHRPPHFYMPKDLVAPLEEIMRLWSRIEEHEYKYHFHGVDANQDYPLKPPFFFRSFPTLHRVSSNGYTVFARKKKLKRKYSGLSQDELLKLRRGGAELNEFVEEPVVSFTGDTKIEILDSCPWIKKSKILILETTFADERKTVENARQWGHIHIDELLSYLPRLECEKLVLIHFSARYKTSQLQQILKKKCSRYFPGMIEIFPRPI